MEASDRHRGCLLGLAVGDAVGTTVEFLERGTFPEVVDMTGGGPFNLNPGEWTDDTSLALCLATSLVERHGFDPRDQMERYCRWMVEGYLSSNGRCFDIGGTTAGALRRFKAHGTPFSGSTDPRTAGNGSIMRLAPVPMFFHRDYQDAVNNSAESSRTTHAAAECVMACRLFGSMLFNALAGKPKEEVLFESGDAGPFAGGISTIARGQYRDKAERHVRGFGYVVESLEAALWCFWNTDNYRDAVLKAVNLGDDADTTAAVCGQLAGAFYGVDGIPEEWLNRLVMHDEIALLADRLMASDGVTP